MMLHRRFVLLLAVGILLNVAFECSADQFYVASWNVENLFDTQDDRSVTMDEDFTPNSPKRWTRERLEIKLNNLASVIKKMNGGRGPDVLGLCEVENRKVVEMLVAKLGPLGRKYEIVHQDSPSDRGIDCALLYDANVFSLQDAKFHFVDADKTRDIVEVKLQHDGVDLYVFVNHWPSRGNDEWQRIMAATVLRKRLDKILAGEPDADIVMVGDFNDEPQNVALAKFLAASDCSDSVNRGMLYDTSAPIKANHKGTYVFDNSWELIDHIIVSAGMLDSSGFRWKRGSTETIEFPEIFYLPRFPGAIPRPSRSYSGDDFHKNGYSDHLALGCIVEH